MPNESQRRCTQDRTLHYLLAQYISTMKNKNKHENLDNSQISTTADTATKKDGHQKNREPSTV